jgi:hypothetical protein
MRMAYLTTDEVNLDLAQTLAERADVCLVPLAPRDALPDGACDAVLCDLDYLPAELREEILAAALAGRPGRPLALHGYNLDGQQTAALRRNGVIVARRLEAGLFSQLRRAVKEVRAAALLTDVRGDPVA